MTTPPNASAKLKVSTLATPAAHWFVAVAPAAVAAPRGSSPRPSTVLAPKAAKTLYVGSLNAGAS